MWLIVEVADTTLTYDGGTKLPLYAAAGVPEVWIVDLGQDAAEVYRAPTGRRYERTETRRRGETLEVEALPGATLRVDEVVGQEEWP